MDKFSKIIGMRRVSDSEIVLRLESHSVEPNGTILVQKDSIRLQFFNARLTVISRDASGITIEPRYQTEEL